jgi:hypothetical protein
MKKRHYLTVIQEMMCFGVQDALTHCSQPTFLQAIERQLFNSLLVT